MKVSFQRTKKEDFYTHYVVGVLGYAVILRHFILKLIIEDYAYKKITPWIS